MTDNSHFTKIKKITVKNHSQNLSVKRISSTHSIILSIPVAIMFCLGFERGGLKDFENISQLPPFGFGLCRERSRFML
jgi:hypothetical protein